MFMLTVMIKNIHFHFGRAGDWSGSCVDAGAKKCIMPCCCWPSSNDFYPRSKSTSVYSQLQKLSQKLGENSTALVCRFV